LKNFLNIARQRLSKDLVEMLPNEFLSFKIFGPSAALSTSPVSTSIGFKL
jgi:hypothetical protein